VTAREEIRGLLLDIDGTLLEDDRAIPGAADAIDRLRGAGIPFRLLTNTSRRSRRTIARVLQEAGIKAEADEILTPAALARRRITDSGRLRARLLIPAEARSDLPGVLEEEPPDWLVLGDLGPDFTYERLNAAFRSIREGASFLALHKNRFWYAGDRGWVLDAGAYVAALEYATGVQADVVGKPAPAFFHLALAELGLPPAQVLVVGDDRQADIEGGSAAGCRTALVRTGRFVELAAPGTREIADMLLASIADLEIGRLP
jgi:HAD superfamily hydrolase (TIGR01458 family)